MLSMKFHNVNHWHGQGAATGRSRDTDSKLETLAAAVGVLYYIRKYVLGSSGSRVFCRFHHSRLGLECIVRYCATHLSAWFLAPEADLWLKYSRCSKLLLDETLKEGLCHKICYCCGWCCHLLPLVDFLCFPACSIVTVLSKGYWVSPLINQKNLWHISHCMHSRPLSLSFHSARIISIPSGEGKVVVSKSGVYRVEDDMLLVNC